MTDKAKTMTYAQRILPLMTVLLTSALLGACGESAEETPQLSAEELAQLSARSQAFQGRDAHELTGDEQALALGRELAVAHCAGCHGVDGANPSRGVPDLTAAGFDYGDTAADIRATITHGRHSIMPPLGAQMGEVEIGALVALVQSFSGGKPPTTFADTAQELYQEHCVVCHGSDGKGGPQIGAPDLTDDYWIHGDSMMNIRLNITRGLDVQCPAQEDLSPTEIELLTAWVLDLRQS